MSSMSEIVAEHTPLTDGDHHWLRLLVSEWQLLADLSFSDLVLWVPDHDPHVFWAAAQIRPTTGPTSLYDDVVGDLIAYSPDHLVTTAFMSGRLSQTSDGKLRAGIPVRTRAIPVILADRVIAVVEQHTSQLGIRAPSSLEQAYLETSDVLGRMITAGAFPMPEDAASRAFSPRVGDGFIRLDAGGEIEYASPNALSAYRRLGLIGDLVDEHLPTVTGELMPDGAPVDDSVQSVLSGRAARRTELVAGDAYLMVRVIPLLDGEVRVGAIVLCRDVSDLRSKERELVTKDATIREIHHRVKNNLQTVAALLRMQARRVQAPEAKVALNDAMSRVAAIAIVHETLSQAFDEFVEFDRVVDGVLRMLGDLAATWGGVSAVRRGSFGFLSAPVATSLAMVITELCQNAVEHGLADRSGEVVVSPSLSAGLLHVEINDNGRGLPRGFDWRESRSLGLYIVRTLVAEMAGTFELGAPSDGPGGTKAVVEIPL